MAFERLTNNLKGLTDNGQEYLKISKDYYKLRLFKHSMKALIGVATLTIRGIFGLIFLLFISVGVAIALSQYFENAAAGFFLVGGFYLLVFLLIYFFAKDPMEKMLLEKYSKMAFAKETLLAQQEVILTQKLEDEGIL